MSNKILIIASSVGVVVISIIASLVLMNSTDQNPIKILDYQTKYEDGLYELYIKVDGNIPTSSDSLPISDSAVGFGYGLFGISLVGEHMQAGPDHVSGIIIIFDKETAKWNSAKINASLVIGTDDSYCIESLVPIGNVLVNKNIITIKASSSFVQPTIYNKVAFELLPEICHGNNIIKLLE